MFALVLWISALFVPGACAYETSSKASDYVRTTFTVEDGLPDNTINTILQTQNGLLWVGTASGLASFDGRTFTNIELRIPGGSPPSSVNSLIEGAEGDLWVGSDAGIVRIPKSDLNDPFLAASTAYRLGQEHSDEVHVLFRAANGEIWAGTSHGLYRFNGSQFVSTLSSTYISRIRQLRDGRLLLITGSGLAEYNGSQSAKYLSVGARLGVKDSEIFDIYEDSSGTLWYCTNNGIRAIGDAGFRHLAPAQPASTATFRATLDSNGVQWVATGIGLFAVVDGQLAGPAINLSPRAFSIGKDGDLWIGINGGGLAHLQHRTVQMLTKADGLANDLVMTVLAARDGRLWVGNNCGLEVFDGLTFRKFVEKDGLANSCVWALAEDHNQDIWIGTYGGGLIRYHDGAFRQFTMEQGLASRIVFRIVTAQDGSLWVATPDGLSHVVGETIRNYSIADGLSSNQILDVHQDRAGTIWAATQGGVDRLIDHRFVSIPSSSTDQAVLARSFAEDSNGDLYTTDAPKGISRIIDNRLVYQDTPVRLMNMVETPDHSLWFSGHTGITLFREKDLTRQSDSGTPLNYQLFGKADGLNSPQAGGGSPNIAMSRDGRIWVATVGGLAMIEPGKLSPSATRPNIFVARALSDGMRSRIGDRLTLSPGIHHVELTLAVVDLATPEKVRLQYRLEGVDDTWLDGNATRTVVYTNVPAGLHRFYVRATDSSGHWNSESAVYLIVQKPYFYQTKLFQLGAALLAIVVLVFAYIVRIDRVVAQTRRLLEARQIERETIARDLHDTLFQGVEGGLLLINSVTSRIPMEPVARDKLQGAFHEINQVMASARGLIFDRSKPAQSLDFEGIIAAYGEEVGLLSESRFSVSITGTKREIRPTVHEELLSTIKEGISNAFRHANAKEIQVHIAYTRDSLAIRICDDGVGIDPMILADGGRRGHWGIPSMQQRAAKAGGSLRVSRREPQGTEVSIEIPARFAFRSRLPGSLASWFGRDDGRGRTRLG